MNRIPKHHDMITYEPEAIRIVDFSKQDIIKSNNVILLGLEDRHMTAKEIHDLYLDPDSGKHEKTLKTIYRYLENLEQENLVVKSGQRMTEGKRTTEALYCKVAKLIFIDDDPLEAKWFDSPIGEEMGDHVAELLCSWLSGGECLQEASRLLTDFYRLVDREMDTMIRASLDDKKLEQSLLKTISGKKTNKVTHFASVLAVILKYPELFDELRKKMN